MKNHIFIKDQGQYIRLEIDKVIWIKSTGETCSIHTDKKEYKVKFPLKSLIENISEHRFVKICESIFVNLKHIISIDLVKNKVQLSNKKLLIEPSYKAELVTKLNVLKS